MRILVEGNGPITREWSKTSTHLNKLMVLLSIRLLKFVFTGDNPSNLRNAYTMCI